MQIPVQIKICRNLTYSGGMRQCCHSSLPASLLRLLLLLLLLLLLKLPLLCQTVAIVGQLMLQHVAKFICIFLWLFPLVFAVVACVTRFFSSSNKFSCTPPPPSSCVSLAKLMEFEMTKICNYRWQQDLMAQMRKVREGRLLAGEWQKVQHYID